MKLYFTPVIKITELTLSDSAYLCGNGLDASIDADFSSDLGDTDEW